MRRGARPAGVAAALAFAVTFAFTFAFADPYVFTAARAAAGTADEATSPQPVEYERLLKLLAARRHGHVTFTEVQRLAILDRPLESSGELLYDAPDRLEKRTLNPRAETLVLEHGVLTAHRGHRTYLMPLRDYPQVAPFIESIRATLAGDREALERLFRVGFEGSLAHWSLLLVPTDARLAGAVREIRIEGERDAIRSVDIRHGDGDRSLLRIGPEVSP
ncbi:MAG: outer membrane lipoprotein carrier protein LolA [Gammaproteobacteria bacterium]|nr:MAG: outer membrane lipoprotein carrier protein LolA [Gammaproteobacteria bacterium]TLZ18828.1 MAG: outer membrane lipoprotein carrier protein LolA [Gammaproteobacteria bacterium]